MAKHIVNQLQVEDRLEYNSFVSGFRTQATAASTLNLVVGDATIQVFTGSTAGQIVRTPNATTLLAGRHFEIINASTVPLTLQDNGGNVLAYISQGRKCIVFALTVASANGTWQTYNDFISANYDLVSQAGPFATLSQITYTTMVTYNTPNLALGDYAIHVGAKWSSGTNNRAADFQVTDNASVVASDTMGQGPAITAAYNEYQRKLKLSAISGVRTITFDFKVNLLGAATITVVNASFEIKRVA